LSFDAEQGAFWLCAPSRCFAKGFRSPLSVELPMAALGSVWEASQSDIKAGATPEGMPTPHF
jgi:hypothetical protein